MRAICAHCCGPIGEYDDVIESLEGDKVFHGDCVLEILQNYDSDCECED